MDERDRQRDAVTAVDQAKESSKVRMQMTLCRVAPAYRGRVIEPRLTTKHAAHWIASLEHHVAPEIWHKPIANIQPPELLAALVRVRSLSDSDVRVPEKLSRVRQRLDAVFEDAIFHNVAVVTRQRQPGTQFQHVAEAFTLCPQTRHLASRNYWLGLAELPSCTRKVCTCNARKLDQQFAGSMANVCDLRDQREQSMSPEPYELSCTRIARMKQSNKMP